jgi:diguanylate cyclase (GGDEF)-like protein/PAS domain S-box-containing protein
MSRPNNHTTLPGAPNSQHDINPPQIEKQRLQELMDGLNSSVFVALLTVDGSVTYANRAALEAVGTTPEQVVGHPFDTTPWWSYSEVARQRLRAAIQVAAEGVGSRFEVPVQIRDGGVRIIDFTLHPVFGHDGKIAYLIASGGDITDRKRAEEALRLTQFTVDNAGIAIFQIWPDGFVRYVNDAACRLLGYPREALLSLPVHAFNFGLTEAGWLKRWSELRTKGSRQFESIYRHCDGHEIPVEISASHIKYEDEEYVFSFVIDLTERKAAEQQIYYLSNYDGLTGLANRDLFLERVNQYISQSPDVQYKLAVVIADVERFRTINATLGRHMGDQLLKQIADRFAHYLDGKSRLARIGADQFAIVAPAVKCGDEVGRRIEQRLQECFGTSFSIGDMELRVSARFGVAMFPADGGDPDSLFKYAEAALHKAKATGEKYMFHTQHMTDRTATSLMLENKLRQALDREEFVLYYQPKVSLRTQRIEGLEALIRWKNSDLRLVPPLEFIPVLEETGMILEVGAWALRKAAQDHRQWLEQGLRAPRIAVNVSAVQLTRRDFVQTVQQALAHGSSPPGIDLEITESVVMQDIQLNIDKLTTIRKMGIGLAIDDFGTGYSSLAYLTKLPAQMLKIDRSFICTMLDEPDTMTLVAGIISLAHSLRFTVVAEGVETQAQADALRSLGCDQMQGYLFSVPLPVEQITQVLANQTVRAIHHPSPSHRTG